MCFVLSSFLLVVVVVFVFFNIFFIPFFRLQIHDPRDVPNFVLYLQVLAQLNLSREEILALPGGVKTVSVAPNA